MAEDTIIATVPPEPEWAAFLAIDWADQKHHWKLVSAGSPHTQQGEVDHTPEAIDDWAAQLHSQFGGRPIAVCLEQSRGSLVYMLHKYPYLVLYPVCPTTSARFREALYPSGSKSDPSDTDVLLELLLHHRSHLRRLDPDTPETRLLQMLVEQRRKLVNDRTSYSNQLTACLKLYFPQVLKWIDNIDSPLGCDLLERWPTLEQLQRTYPDTLRKFFVEHNSRSEERIQERIDAIYQAKRAVEDEALLQGGAATTQGLVAILKTLNTCIAQLDERIAAAESVHPDSVLFAGLPGAGPALRPRLIVAFGTRRERYSSAAELLSYSGIAPVTEQSGHTKWVHFRRACPQFLRQTFHEFASHSIVRSGWARAYYDLQISRGKGHHAAVRALAAKWIRVLFRCWKDRIQYDEQTYLRALAKHHSPLHGLLEPATTVEWKTVAGFQKLSLKNT
jgi:transposase